MTPTIGTRERCDDCGGDGQTHLNVAADVARRIHAPISELIDLPCVRVNAVSRALLAVERAIQASAQFS